jgi:hypothetical protein
MTGQSGRGGTRGTAVAPTLSQASTSTPRPPSYLYHHLESTEAAPENGGARGPKPWSQGGFGAAT